MPTRALILLLFICFAVDLSSQNEASKWYFGNKLGVDFMTTPPTVLTNGSTITEEGCSSIADPAGNLLFYTTGDTVWNRLHVPMANGTGLFGHKSAMQHVIVKRPGTDSIYYIFHNSSGLVNGGGLFYSIVNMSLASGNGSVTTKNVQLFTPGLEKVAAVKHCNRIDVWVVSHEHNTANFRSYLLTASGLNTVPVISTIGPVLTYTAWGGQIKLSPCGRKAAMWQFEWDPIGSKQLNDFYLFDFDDATGILSNLLTLPHQTSGPAWNVSSEFTADGSRLYALADQKLYQWDLCAGSSSAIVASKDSIPAHEGRLQMAPDGKIYASFQATHSALSVINTPSNNLPSAGFVSQSIILGNTYIHMSLPGIMSTYLKKLTFPSPSVTCGIATFTAPQFCDAQSRPIQNISWNFGDPISGNANTSTLNLPSHNYSAPGNYTVKLILHNNCGTDTITQLVAITELPQLGVAGKTVICNGESTTFTVTGASSYTWNGASGSNTISFSPTTTTVYTVSGTSTANCVGSRTLSVKVEPCLGVSESSVEMAGIKIYPNPANTFLRVEGGAGKTIRILDLTGKVHAQYALVNSLQEIDLDGISDGLWLLEINGEKRQTHFKFIKERQ